MTVVDRPLWRLTRHFFSGLFRLGFLTDEGADAFTRVVIGIAAVLLSLGLLVARVYMGKYAALGHLPTADPYVRALVADEALVIALPMWLVALIAVLASRSLFPDHTDFRVLTPLPVDRSTIFGAKLLAIVLFAGIFALYAWVALLPLVIMMSLGRSADATFLRHLAGYVVSSVSACAFSVVAIAAVNGVVIVWAPPRLAERALTIFRSVMIGALVVAAPLLMRLPAQGDALARASTAFYLVPPVWFVGVWSVVLGRQSSYLMSMSTVAAVAFLAAAGVAAVAYLLVYRRFDLLMLRPAAIAPGAQRTTTVRWSSRRQAAGTASTAVRTFMRLTLARSALHQSVAVGIASSGVGLVVSTLLSQRLPLTLAWAPFALLCTWSLAVWAALLLPIEHRANWIFRMTERPTLRLAQLGVAPAAMRFAAIAVPTTLFVVPQWRTLGPAWTICAVLVQALYGTLLVELLVSDWRRVPFTCSYLPGKRFVGHTLLIAFMGWLVFTVTGPVVAYALSRGSRAAAVICVVLAVLVATLRSWRRRMWQELPLMFDDELPVDVLPIRLTDG